MGIYFLKVLNYSYRALRLPIRLVAEAMEGKWDNRGIVEQRRGGTCAWGMRDCRLVAAVGTLD